MHFPVFLLVLLLLLGQPFSATASEDGPSQADLDYLAAKRAEEGVITLPSGLSYKVLHNGTGHFHPGPTTPCQCHYHGTLSDGTVFDSSLDRGQMATFAPTQVIKGWTEAMQLMVERDEWELYLPPELAYGERGSPPTIPPHAVLTFTIQIMELQGESSTWKRKLTCRIDSTDDDTCNDKEKKYVTKTSAWTNDKIKTEVKRLEGLRSSQTAGDLVDWMERRLHILKQKHNEL